MNITSKYRMNSGKKSDDDKPMIAKDPQKQKHEDEVYDEIYKVYEPQIKQNFHDQIYAGIKQDLLVKFYKNAIAQTLVKAGQSEEDANAYVEANKEAIEKDPEAFVKKNLPDAAEPLKQEADKFIKNAEEKGVEVSEGVTMTVEQLTQQQLDSDDPALDMDGDGTKETSFKQAIPIYAKQAATGMTTGVINYWEGTQFGAFGMGTSVCLGYSRAFSYLVQCLDKDIYLKDPSKGYDSKKTVTADDGTTSEVCDNWKTAKELYYGSDGKTLDINAGYTVDLVRISFQSNVTMYGEEQEDFGSDHYWNAVKVDGQWYYVDPCYTDVYTEVMSRDRVETDGDMNHVFFLFSDTDARKLYQGNFSVLRSLYQNEATDTTYEKAWMARAASNVYYADGYAYYMYDSTDLFDRVSSTSMNQSQKAAEYKIVRHKLTNKDTGDGDSDYETLINFTDKKNDDDDDTFVSVLNKDGKMEKNDLLTKLYAQFVDEQSIYPSIGLTAALYTDGKIYFNVSNDIVSYNPADGAVAVVKEYNTVSAKRDNTKLFGGMAFTTTDEKSADFTVTNHPIAGLTVKGDELVVSIGTNFAFISGKSKLLDHSSYGYEFEETDYNPTYTNYKKYQQFMGSQSNDNDEFMWSANFVDTVDLKTLTGDSHNYKTVSVPATCGRNAFTEERCSDCGLIKDGTRVEEEGTAHEHHYIKFHETYYTKTDSGNWNEADNYVCPECGACITEPVKSKYEQANSTYEKRKAIWDEAQKNAAEGHAYTATDAEWSDDHTSVTFQNLKCETCANQINKLDCLLESDENATNKANRDSIEKALAEKVTATAKLAGHTGTCEQGVTMYYKAADKTADGVKYVVTTTEAKEAGKHAYTGAWTWNEVKDDNGNVTNCTASVTGVKCSVCDNEPTEDQIKVNVVKDTENSKAATCTEAGKDVYTATATVTDADGKEIGTLTADPKEVDLPALGHKYGEPTWNWTKGENNTYTATATFTCANDEKHVETVDAKVTEKSDGATCTEAGKITYTATVTFEGKDYKDTKTEEVAALGHDYKVSEKDGWKWTADKEKGYTAVATFVCSRCKDSHDETADVVKEDKNSQIIYTATAKYTDETGKEFTATATKSTKMSVSYKVHRQDYDWEEDWKKDGQTSGTEGQCKRLEAIRIKLPDGVSGSIEYRTHIQDIGWEKNWSKDGAKSGTEGQCKRLEAIQIKLTGEVEKNYDVYYSVHAENFGWLGWAKNGEEAGTAGYGYRLEAIRIQLVTKGDKAPELIGTIKEAMKARLVGYQTHVQDYGTQAYVYDGAMAGTEGECKRMESIRMKLPSSVNSSIQYRSHVQDIGWEKKWASNGSLSGTEGQCKRLEAIQIKLSGDVAENYDVYYRVHVQDYGWLAWAKNGESSGTEGYAKRLEAIEVRLVPKGTTPNLPASANEKAFIKK